MASRKLSEPSDLLSLFALLKKLADEARDYGWEVQITLNTGEVDMVSLSATRQSKLNQPEN